MAGNLTFEWRCGGHSMCEPSWTTPRPIRYPEHRLYAVVDGAGRLESPEGDVRLSKGRLYLIPANWPGRNVCPKHMEVYWVHLMMESLHANLLLTELNEVVSWPLSRFAYWQDIYRSFIRLFTEPEDDVFPLRVQGLCLELMAEVLTTRVTDQHRLAVDQKIGPFAPAFAYMDEHFRDNPSLEEVARTVDLHPVYFHRRFKQTFGQSPHAYVQQKRMALARQLLLQTNDAIRDVSEAAGFDSEFYFSRAFRKMFGITPGQLRRQSGAVLP